MNLNSCAKKFVDFVNASPSPFHAVSTCRQQLQAAGFQCLSETESWHLQPLGKYFFTRNQSTIVAFVVGGRYVPGNGMAVLAAHTDSPHPKVKPVSKQNQSGYLQVGVELYGGGIWHTWFDRDLTVAGRVVVARGEETYSAELVHIPKALMRIPTLAIHLDRSVRDGFKFNDEMQMVSDFCVR